MKAQGFCAFIFLTYYNGALLMCELGEGERIEELLIDNLKIVQNENLYRFTSDSVLLSKFVKGKNNDVVADFCSGSGIVGIHFWALNKNIQSVALFEMQKELYEASVKSIKLNSLENFSAFNIKIQDIPREYDDKFSLILCNPPYERASGGFENSDYKKAVCRKELTVTLSEIVDCAYKKLKFGGRLAMINRADRLAEVIYVMKSRGIEPKRLQLASGSNKKPYLLMIEGVKGGKEGIEVLENITN